MPTYSERLETAVTSAEVEAAKLYAIVNGAYNAADVVTAGGNVKPIAKVIYEGQQALAAAVGPLEEDATEAAAAAAVSATNASNAATTAAGSATTATTQATNAANSASAASTSQTAANTSAINAAASAAAALTSQNAAATSATGASNSASAAATSATAAGNSATAAAGSATTAGTHATTATTQAGIATTQAGIATTGASTATTQATASATSASQASTSATNAANSATAAATSASSMTANVTACANSAAAALASQNAAAASQTAASTSASAALVSQGQAATSATAAATSAAQAAAIAAGLNYKGTQAGASVPATSTASGDCYAILSAGTSQSKTWVAGDLAIYRGTSGQWDQIPATVVLGISAALRNALAPRGGVSFDGTASNRVSVLLTGQNIATDAFSLNYLFTPPTASNANSPTLWHLSTDATDAFNDSNCVGCAFDASGNLTITFSATFATHYRTATVAGFLAAYGGKPTHLLVTRSGATLKIYINGVDTAYTTSTNGTDPTWAMSITSNYLHIGYQGSNNIAYWPVYAVSLYNTALTASDALEVCELGGAVPERFKFGSQAAIYSSNFSGVGLDGWSGNGGVSHAVTSNVDQDADGAGVPPSNDWLRATSTAAATLSHYRTARILLGGKRWKVTGDIFIPSGSVITTAQLGTEATPSILSTNITLTPGAVVSASWEGTMVTNGDLYLQLPPAVAGAGASAYIKNFVVKQVGAVCHLDLDDGIGRVARDKSSNKLRATLTATGISHVIESDDGIYPQAALTANGELLDTAGVLRTDCVLVDVVVKNTTANQVAAFGIGMSSGVRDLTYETDIPANATVVLPIKRADLAGLTVGTSPFGRVYFSAVSWNSGSLNISIRYRRERDL